MTALKGVRRWIFILPKRPVPSAKATPGAPASPGRTPWSACNTPNQQQKPSPSFFIPSGFALPL